MKLDIKNLTLWQLSVEFKKLGLRSFRARQVFRWIWLKGVRDWSEMSDISKELRTMFAERYRIGQLKVKSRTGSAKQGVVKHLFELEDGSRVEGVWLKDGSRRTVCVSTQAGCSLGCTFCRTAQMGLKRNLLAGEIAGQVLAISKGQAERITNVVFMGMGEPFLNYDACLDAARILNSDFGPKIGARKITISTAGITEGIRRLASEPEQFKLAISLNAADQKTRERLMPIAHRYPLTELMQAVRDYTSMTNKRVTFEYVLLRGVNDRPRDASALILLLQGIPCKINLIPFNPYPGTDYEAPTEVDVNRFSEVIMPHLPAVMVRKSLGGNIFAGCGQLALLQPTADS
ncbi:23S rRNA (adenine(2503)-C(2))-methyltransferase RlmN [candidate division WOR-3 bacterium]|uniref:Probable dual-specificity RNA methyltransferase RlmN n=1 Tax=candidate division WOR-3 bacterium TaxID=2052148 RepID=A0A9D5KC55_UNCW3|nr:23S rRNA (adenine(2503)-C(2))-methyltransferase RlmN [candidate division WOR-3 bacterium]MBD3365464.1 23S rRNA (adenine(2503)-C(2))-methyltransferase RlmN [candidate division WOR-3 bacterium]